MTAGCKRIAICAQYEIERAPRFVLAPFLVKLREAGLADVVCDRVVAKVLSSEKSWRCRHSQLPTRGDYAKLFMVSQHSSERFMFESVSL